MQDIQQKQQQQRFSQKATVRYRYMHSCKKLPQRRQWGLQASLSAAIAAEVSSNSLQKQYQQQQQQEMVIG